MLDEMSLHELAARVRHLEDMDEIRRLYLDYGQHLDAGDVDAYAELFTQDAKLRLTPVLRADGRDEIRRVAESGVRPAHRGQGAVHVLGAPRIDLDDDRASGDCVWAAVSVADDGTPQIVVGRHIDELAREDGRWRFSSRKGILDVGALG